MKVVGRFVPYVEHPFCSFNTLVIQLSSAFKSHCLRSSAPRVWRAWLSSLWSWNGGGHWCARRGRPQYVEPRSSVRGKNGRREADGVNCYAGHVLEQVDRRNRCDVLGDKVARKVLDDGGLASSEGPRVRGRAGDTDCGDDDPRERPKNQPQDALCGT
jgi:hypothetical protein